MPDLKFSCSECGQHISCGPEWAGHSLECPSCHSHLVAPQPPTTAAPALSPAPAPESPASRPAGVRIAVTANPSPKPPPPAASPRKVAPRPPSGDNSLLKYGFGLVLVAILGSVAYFYIAPMVQKGLESGDSRGASPARSGPMGEMNEAMDVSDALDGGGSSSRPRPKTNAPTRGAAPHR